MSKPFVFASSIALALVAVGCASNSGEGCATPCLDSQICCDGECVFHLTDRRHCGTCGNACSGSCSGGTCVGTNQDGGPPPSMCDSSCDLEANRCCGTFCVPRTQPLNVDGRPSSTEDPRSPFNNCNGCGLRCDPTTAISCSMRPGDMRPDCMCGEFQACPAGEVCMNDGGRWQCINTSSNPGHCGEIGRACAPGETCTGGVCTCGGMQCSDGQACCAGTCVDIMNDSMNCGGCGNICTPNAPNCVGGSCICAESGRVCEAPTPGGIFGGGSTGESCCPGRGCVPNTDADCGCMACPPDEMCVVGGSGLPLPGGGMGMEIPTVCCGDDFAAFIGCGGFPFPLPGGDGGLPFPIPGFDGGLPFP